MYLFSLSLPNMTYYQPLVDNLVPFVSSSGFGLPLSTLTFQKFLQSTIINLKFQSDENVKDGKNAENVENGENAENVENIENIENVENVENVKNAEIIENISHPHDVIVPTGPEIDNRVEINNPVRVLTLPLHTHILTFACEIYCRISPY